MTEQLLERRDRVAESTSVGGGLLVLDLENVTLVDADAVRFLCASEKKEIKILRCSLYIRECIRRESGKSGTERND